MRVSMTWPQYRRRECSIDGRIARLREREAEILLVLMLNSPDHFICRDKLIEALWPNPELEPESAPISCMHVYMTRLRHRGVIIENWHGVGWRIPREGRFDSERLRLAA